MNKDTAGLKDWLTEVAKESNVYSDVITARSLLSRLENAETYSVFYQTVRAGTDRSHNHFFMLQSAWNFQLWASITKILL